MTDLAPTFANTGVLTRHGPGCQCWPHVSERDATDAIEAVALAEYRDGKRTTVKEQEPDRDAEQWVRENWTAHLDGDAFLRWLAANDPARSRILAALARTGAPPALPATPAETGLREALRAALIAEWPWQWRDDHDGTHRGAEEAADAVLARLVALESPREER